MEAGFLFLLGALALANGGREVVGLAIYHILSLGLLLARRRRRETPATALDLPLSVFVLLAGSSAAYAMATRMRGLLQFSTLLLHVSNFYLFSEVQGERFQNRFLRLLTILCVVFALPALAFRLRWLDLRFVPLPNVDLLAGFLNCGILSLLAKASHPATDSDGRRNLINKLIPVVLGGASFALFSWGAFAALAVGTLALLIAQRSRKILIFCGLAAVGAVPLFALSGHAREHVTWKLSTLLYNKRVILWKGSLRAFGMKPLQGWGLGTFGQVYEQCKLPIPSDIAQYEDRTPFAHCEYLQMGVETGVLGLLACLWLAAALLGECDTRLREEEVPDWKTAASIASVAALLTHAAVDFNLHLPLLAFLLAFYAAVIARPRADPARVPRLTRLSAWADLPFFRAALWVWMAAALLALGAGSAAALAERFQNTHPPAAARLWSLAVRLNPLYSNFLSGRASFDQGPEKEALLARAARFNPGEGRYQANLARFYFDEGRFQESAERYQRAIADSPRNVFYRSELGDLFLRDRRLDDARLLYRQAVELEPFYAFAHDRLGEIDLAQGRKEEALRSFENVVRIESYGLHPLTDYSRRLLDFDVRLAQERIRQLKGERIKTGHIRP